MNERARSNVLQFFFLYNFFHNLRVFFSNNEWMDLFIAGIYFLFFHLDL